MSTIAPTAFGELLRRHRHTAELTQEALAERAGLSVDGIQKLERGVTHPYRDTVQRLVTALQLAGAGEHAFREAATAPRQRRSLLAPLDPALPTPNLPHPLTSFVGRERDTAAVQHLLDRARLVTLTGPGGVGKTRLALAVAATLAETSAVEVGLVELAGLGDPDLIPSAIAAALGVEEHRPAPAILTLMTALRRRKLLLVLDNCEHLAAACARTAEALLLGCESVRVLTTSREPLGITGETVWRLAPLGLPAADAATLEELRRSAAGRLFLERAAAAHPTFRLPIEDIPVVARLCRRLDGLPLAIELAAPLVRALTLDEVTLRLDGQFRLLTGGRTAPTRQQTLRATMDGSYDLLDEPARVIFRRLAVFTGGWTLEAAEAVCSGDGIDREDVLAHLIRLVDQSLVVVEERPPGAGRYRMLETLREYAGERLLASGEDEALRARHAAYYLALADVGAAAPLELDLAAKRAMVALAATEHGNLRAAWRWLLDRQEVARGLGLVGALEQAGYRRGHLAEGQALLRTLLTADMEAEPSPAVVRALAGAAGLAHFCGGDYAAAQALAERLLAAQRRVGNRAGVAAALSMLALTRREQGDHLAARALLEESLAIQREVGDRAGIASTVNRLGEAAHALGDFAGARVLYEQARQLARAVGNPKLLPWPPHDLGCLALDRGDYPAARSLFAESLTIWREHADAIGTVYSLIAFAGLAAAEGRPERAMRLAGAATGLADAFGIRLAPTYRRGFERRLTAARQGLSAEAAATAWARGRALTLDQAVAGALDEDA
jgi:non-specific serine/threonine protein kinase